MALGVVVALIGSTLAGASAPQAEKPKADDVGITPKEIRLAVVADVENPVVPGLFQAGVDGMRAWAKLVNKQGGIAGRKVVIDFIDSRLSPDDARNAVIKACAEDFAMVGSEALFLNNVDDMVACKNNHGEGVGLPDLPGLALDPAQRCSPVTYVAVGDSKFCSTRDQNPQTYYTNQGDFRYYLSKQKDLHGIFAVPSDLKSTKDSVLPQVESAVALGDQEGRRGVLRHVRASPAKRSDPADPGRQGQQLELRVQRQRLHDHGAPPQGGKAPGHRLGEVLGVQPGLLRQAVRGTRRRRRGRHVRGSRTRCRSTASTSRTRR